jgi:hypothetical protein
MDGCPEIRNKFPIPSLREFADKPLKITHKPRAEIGREGPFRPDCRYFPDYREFGHGDWFRGTASAATQTSETPTLEPAARKADFAATSRGSFQLLSGLSR